MKTLPLLLLLCLSPLAALAGGFAPFPQWNGFGSQAGGTYREAYWHNGRIHYRHVFRHPRHGDKGSYRHGDIGKRMDQWARGIDKRVDRAIQRDTRRAAHPRIPSYRGGFHHKRR